MKKRVCSILLAAVLCVTMLSVVALATECADGAHTYDENLWAPNANGISHSRKCDNCGYVDTSSSQHRDDGLNNNAKDGKCDYCDAELAVSFNDLFRTICATTWEAAFKEIGSTSGTLYPIADTTETITYNEKGNVTINLAGLTINKLKVTKGTLTITGSGTITKLEVSGGTVQLSGGTYGTITPPAGKSVNDLLAPGYYAVQTANGISVQQAPITNVTVSVSNNDNTVYGYSEADAPVLTATVTPSDLQGVTYQWYKVNGSEKTAIVNATAQTYTVETGLNAGNYDYCCTATVDTYPLTSGDVTVTIKKANGPQLGTINVNQVFNDTASKTINIYESIGTALDQLKADAGTLRFHSGTYSPENTIKSGWGVDVNTGAITYQLAEGLSVGQTITITMQVGYNEAYSKNHKDATVTVNIALTMATPTGTPNYTPITSSGKTLADAHLNADNNVFSVPGNVMWAVDGDPESVKVEKGTAYEWIFRPNDDEHFEVIRGSIILWTESGSGVVIIVPSQSGESTPASNPNTGAAHVGQPLPGLALLALAALCLYAGTRRF